MAMFIIIAYILCGSNKILVLLGETMDKQIDKNKLCKNYEDAKELFDFDHVEIVMEKLNWSWYSSGTRSIPTKKEIIDNCDQLFNSLLESKNDIRWVMSGGLRVAKLEGDCIEITFIVEWARSDNI